MKVGIVGIGLIGGSITKRLSNCGVQTFIFDSNVNVLNKALKDNNSLLIDDYDNLDLLIIALPPNATISFIENNSALLKNVLVTDVCGVKKCVSDVCEINIIKYFGMHPMAGREVGGYENSLENLFDGANLIVTSNIIPPQVEKIIKMLGFTSPVVSSPDNHDKVIAYTSQLCHIASNAFAKSPTISTASGFTGGSFEDLTRVGKLDSSLWMQLFDLNRANLINEIEIYIDNLIEYKDALKCNNDSKLISLLDDGTNCLKF